MVQILKIFLLIFLSILLQTTLIGKISIFGIKPDLPLALTVAIALLRGSLYGEIVGFISGFFFDISSGGPFIGIQSFSKTLIGYSIGLLRGRFYSDNIVTQSLSGFISIIADKLITLISLGLLLTNLPFPHIRLHGLILVSIINSLMVIIVFKVLSKLFKNENQWL